MSQTGTISAGGGGGGGAYISVTPFIVGQPGDTHAGYTTIQAAITAANAAGASSTNMMNVYIKPGAYTENLAIRDGINIIGFDPALIFPTTVVRGSVVINGTITSADVNAVFQFSNVTINAPNAATLISFSNNNTAATFSNCYLNITNGVLLANSSTTCAVQLESCSVEDTLGNGVLFSTGSQGITLNVFDNSLVNMGGANTTTYNSSLNFQVYNSQLNAFITLAPTSNVNARMVLYYSMFIGGIEFDTAFYAFFAEFCDFTQLGVQFPNGSGGEFISCLLENQFFNAVNNPSIFVNCDNLLFPNNQSSNYTASSFDYIIFVDSTSGPVTITLPATANQSQSCYFIIKDVGGDAGTNHITIDGNGNTIDGAATLVLSTNYAKATIVIDTGFTTGTNWFTI